MYCEKPVGRSAAETARAALAVRNAGVLSAAGYNYRHFPMARYCKQLLEEGKFGKVEQFNARFLSMYGGDPLSRLSWRFQNEFSGSGAVGDILSHAADMGHFLAGPIRRVSAMRKTFIAERPLAKPGGDHFALGDKNDPKGAVENEDYVAAMAEFEGGARGVLEASRVARGPKCAMNFEVYGERGSAKWDFERMNELQLYLPDGDPSREGYARLLGGVAHPGHAQINPGDGIGVGYEDSKTLEAFYFMQDIAAGRQKHGRHGAGAGGGESERRRFALVRKRRLGDGCRRRNDNGESIMKTKRMTMARALVNYLAAQRVETDSGDAPLFGGVFAIFGHGNVTCLGEALYAARDSLPTWRGQNEQAMVLAAAAYAKAKRRRQIFVATSSIGPGATNMITGAALAHANRLPTLLLAGDTFANRLPDPVLQQVENFYNPSLTVNDAFRPVVRYWDRIVRPQQLLSSLPQAVATMLDPADCGPAFLALPQDVQAEAFDCPEIFLTPTVHRIPRPRPDKMQLEKAAAALARAKKPLLICGGGVHYSLATSELAEFATRRQIPVVETIAGRAALVHDHPQNAGALGVIGSSSANALAAEADVVVAVGTRLQDFTTGSWSVFGGGEKLTLIGINAARFDACKHRAVAVVGDAREGLAGLDELLGRISRARLVESKRPPVVCGMEQDGGFLRWRKTVAADLCRSCGGGQSRLRSGRFGADGGGGVSGRVVQELAREAARRF